MTENFKALLAELYESPVRKECFAYCAETNSCTVCTELLCEQPEETCPFFKTNAQMKKEEAATAQKLLMSIKKNRALRQRLKERGITESDLRERVRQRSEYYP